MFHFALIVLVIVCMYLGDLTCASIFAAIARPPNDRRMMHTEKFRGLCYVHHDMILYRPNALTCDYHEFL